jgi:uncharacterized membrane protein
MECMVTDTELVFPGGWFHFSFSFFAFSWWRYSSGVGCMPSMMGPMWGHHHSHHDESVSAKDILDRRYARGEIGHDEYLKIKQDLESK